MQVYGAEKCPVAGLFEESDKAEGDAATAAKVAATGSAEASAAPSAAGSGAASSTG